MHGSEGRLTMSLAEVYSQQYGWRRWSTIYPALGDLSGTQVTDLGCGIGDQSRDLSRLGAHVLGVDANREIIDHAVSRGIPRARFVCDKITNLANHELESDGIWTSFTAAYFPQFEVFLRSGEAALKPGGWLGLTELDDLFAHEPLASRWRAVVNKYYAQSLEQGFYRFRSHDHVSNVLSERGWRIDVDRTLEDDEFCFVGPASADVLEAWTTRLDLMMPQFVARFGDEAVGFDSAFLQCLASDEHRSCSRVWFILARAPDGSQGAGEQEHAADGVARRR
jgi:SAM-dependent methyltransferase